AAPYRGGRWCGGQFKTCGTVHMRSPPPAWAGNQAISIGTGENPKNVTEKNSQFSIPNSYPIRLRRGTCSPLGWELGIGNSEFSYAPLSEGVILRSPQSTRWDVVMWVRVRLALSIVVGGWLTAQAQTESPVLELGKKRAYEITTGRPQEH